jgi:cyclophilin family peptidyl-prolyl cis-trans isomerase
MKTIKFLSIVLILTAFVSCKKDEPEAPVVIIENSDTMQRVYTLETTMGDISIYLYKDVVLHNKNFDSLAKAGFYDGIIFHRVIDNFMIQGGDPTGTGSGGPGYTLPAEIMNKYKHKHGAVSTARLGNAGNPEKRSSGSQFFIVENKNGYPSLDGQYTVFGETLKGLDVVSAIALVEKDAKDKPTVNVVINNISIKKYTTQELQDNFGFTIP